MDNPLLIMGHGLVDMTPYTLRYFLKITPRDSLWQDTTFPRFMKSALDCDHRFLTHQRNPYLKPSRGLSLRPARASCRYYINSATRLMPRP